MDFDAQVDDNDKVVIVTMSRYFIGDLHDECIKKTEKMFDGYMVKINMAL